MLLRNEDMLERKDRRTSKLQSVAVELQLQIAIEFSDWNDLGKVKLIAYVPRVTFTIQFEVQVIYETKEVKEIDCMEQKVNKIDCEVYRKA